MKRAGFVCLVAIASLASCNALLDNQLGQAPSPDAGTVTGDAAMAADVTLATDGGDGGAPPDDSGRSDGKTPLPPAEAGVEVIVTNAQLDVLQDLATDGASIYWSTVDSCGSATHVSYRAAAIDGTGARTLTTRPTSGAACGLGYCFQVALSPTGVMFTNSADQSAGAVQSVGKDGGPVASLVDNEDVPCAVATLQGRAYWSNGYLARLRTLDTGGVARTALDAVQVEHIVTDGTSLYMTAYSYQAQRAALRGDVAVDGGLTITPLFTATNGRIGGIALSTTHVFWADTESGRILMEPKSGGTPVVVASGLGIPNEVAFSDGYLYFTAPASSLTRGDGLVGRVQIDGNGPVGAVVPIATKQDLPGQIAVDDHYLYWADALSKIYRAPK